MSLRSAASGKGDARDVLNPTLFRAYWNMRSTEDRIVVLGPNAVAAVTVVGSGQTADGYTCTSLVAGHDALVFVARGEGVYRTNGHEGVLRPNTLISAPAGGFTCVLSEEREAYVVTMRDATVTPDDQRAFIPFFERKLSDSDAPRWCVLMRELADRAAAYQFNGADVTRLKRAAVPFLWRRESQREAISTLFESIWPRLAEPLTLERLARDVGYTTNYLNDLTRAHTGRTVGRWITDMRMARARVTLEQTDMLIADVALACGYEDSAYFSRAFRRAHGVSPLTWRIAARPIDQRYAYVTLPMEALHQSTPRRTPERAYSFAS